MGIDDEGVVYSDDDEDRWSCGTERSVTLKYRNSGNVLIVSFVLVNLPIATIRGKFAVFQSAFPVIYHAIFMLRVASFGSAKASRLRTVQNSQEHSFTFCIMVPKRQRLIPDCRVSVWMILLRRVLHKIRSSDRDLRLFGYKRVVPFSVLSTRIQSGPFFSILCITCFALHANSHLLACRVASLSNGRFEFVSQLLVRRLAWLT